MDPISGFVLLGVFIFALMNGEMLIAGIIGLAIFALAIKSNADEKEERIKAPAAVPDTEVMVPVVEDTEAPYLYPKNMRVKLRTDWWGAKHWMEAGIGLGRGVGALIGVGRKLFGGND